GRVGQQRTAVRARLDRHRVGGAALTGGIGGRRTAALVGVVLAALAGGAGGRALLAEPVAVLRAQSGPIAGSGHGGGGPGGGGRDRPPGGPHPPQRVTGPVLARDLQALGPRLAGLRAALPSLLSPVGDPLPGLGRPGAGLAPRPRDHVRDDQRDDDGHLLSRRSAWSARSPRPARPGQTGRCRCWPAGRRRSSPAPAARSGPSGPSRHAACPSGPGRCRPAAAGRPLRPSARPTRRTGRRSSPGRRPPAARPTRPRSCWPATRRRPAAAPAAGTTPWWPRRPACGRG